MWYPPTETAAAASEPITLEQAKTHLRVFHEDDDEYITSLISVARQACEAYCAAYWAERAIEIYADSFCDLAYFPVTPVKSIDEVSYTDTGGVSAEVSNTVYEFQADASRFVTKSGQSWPAVLFGSRVKVAATVGDEVPAPVLQAMKLKIGDLYERRESVPDTDVSTFDNLLTNHRFYGAP
ncbi:head-tail connector protein [Bosea sp. NPDC055332]